MTDTRVSVEGVPELERALDAISADLADMTTTNEKVAKVIAGAAQQRSPYKSGALRASVTGYGTREQAVTEASVSYAAAVEFGSRLRRKDADPFMSDARDASEPIWSRIYEDDVARIVDNDVSRFAK